MNEIYWKQNRSSCWDLVAISKSLVYFYKQKSSLKIPDSFKYQYQVQLSFKIQTLLFFLFTLITSNIIKMIILISSTRSKFQIRFPIYWLQPGGLPTCKQKFSFLIYGDHQSLGFYKKGILLKKSLGTCDLDLEEMKNSYLHA